MSNEIHFPSFISNNEASCPCGCGKMPDNYFLSKINALRTLINFPMDFNFARCEAYNARIGGAKNSAHLKGLAVDIVCHDSEQRYKIVQMAIKIGFQCIEVADCHIHLDDMDRGKDPILIWGKSK